MVQLAELSPREKILDLACGTGLVTLAASTAVGADGRVVAVDISPSMLAVAQEKLKSHKPHNIEFHEHSITDLGALKAIRRGSFDVIICASAMVLLDDPAHALRTWVDYLRPGGRLVVDVTHPQSQLAHITLERVGLALGEPLPCYRLPFQGPNDLRAMMQDAGLCNVRIELISQLDGHVSDDLSAHRCHLDQPRVVSSYTLQDADSKFDAALDALPVDMFQGTRKQAQELFRRAWRGLCDSGGRIYEVDGVFVGRAVKPAE